MSFLIEKYAFREGCCKVTLIDHDDPNTLRVDGPCITCKKPRSMVVNAEKLIAFERGGYVQECFPELSPDDREFLVSGICPDCWDMMFPHGLEEDE